MNCFFLAYVTHDSLDNDSTTYDFVLNHQEKNTILIKSQHVRTERFCLSSLYCLFQMLEHLRCNLIFGSENKKKKQQLQQQK